MSYYTYMLQCSDNTIYTGIAKDINKRMQEHFEKTPAAAKYTRSHSAARLLAVWQSSCRSDAAQLEYRIKQLSRQRKLDLIENNDLSFLDNNDEIEKYLRLYSESLIGRWKRPL